MKILAVDQSFTNSGIVVMKDSQMLHCETFKTDKAKDIYTRTWNIVQKIEQVFDEYKPDIIALESLSFSSNGNATRDLAGLQYSAITYFRFIREVEVEIVHIGTIKKFATGFGNAKKIVLLEHLPIDVRKTFDELGVKKTTGLLDLTDAYWLGRTLEDIHNEKN